MSAGPPGTGPSVQPAAESTGRRRWRLVRAHTDAVPASLRRLMRGRFPGRWMRRGRRWPGGRRGAVAMLAAALAFVVLAGWLLTSSAVFGVQEVRVSGTVLTSPAQVREAAAIPDQTPMLRVDRGQVAGKVAALPEVRSVSVRRSWPHTVVVEVTERTAVAAVPLEEGYALLDADGVVFSHLAEPALELPTLLLAEPGPDDPATRAALVVLAALTGELRAELDTLAVSGPAHIRLELLSGYAVVWGDETGSEEKARVATALLATEAVAGAEQRVIDVSSPEVVVLR